MTSEKKYFNVRIEFDRDALDRKIFKAIETGETPFFLELLDVLSSC